MVDHYNKGATLASTSAAAAASSFVSSFGEMSSGRAFDSENKALLAFVGSAWAGPGEVAPASMVVEIPSDESLPMSRIGGS